MSCNRYRVTWIDNGDTNSQSFKVKELAKAWVNFLENCAVSNSAIREIKLTTT